MAATPPPKTPDRHYDFKSMNVVFAISSLAFLAITLFMVLRDYARPWKRVQAEFRDLDRAAATKQLEEERQQIDQTQIAAVEQEIAKAQADLDTRRGRGRGARGGDRGHRPAPLRRRRPHARHQVVARRRQVPDTTWRSRSGDEKAIAEQREGVDELTARWIEQQREVQELDTERDGEARAAARAPGRAQRGREAAGRAHRRAHRPARRAWPRSTRTSPTSRSTRR